ncbi:hypothetical protein [Acetobacter lambici]|uniref:hypothetical protein n=1 Tax=Acetobacter lambici TaxID=1332824 RepID=UPI0020A5A60A|nr:hypothetical protein [Acetobacter lambici]MCP1243312.1 hypothetical protein [Acetobacter lambici]
MCAYEKDAVLFCFFVFWHPPLFEQGFPLIAHSPAGWVSGRATCHTGTPCWGMDVGTHPAFCWFISKQERQIMLVAGYDKEELT